MSLLATDRTTGFLSTWFLGCSGFIELRAFRGVEVERKFFSMNHVAKVSEWTAKHSDWNIFFGAVPRKDTSSGSEKNLIDLPGLWVDCDFKDFPGGGLDVLEIIDAFKYPPSFLVHTGGGLHGYWKFQTPATPSREFKGQLKGLSRHLRGDPAATDLSRILRLPGSFNHKYEVPLPCVVLRGLP